MTTRERPILFSGEMVRAILDGTKMQTRRMMKPQPEHAQIYEWKGRTLYDGEARLWCWNGHVADDSWHDITTALAPHCPLGAPGDRLWVRETWHYRDWTTDGYPCIGYQADDSRHLCDRIPEAWEQRVSDTWAHLSAFGAEDDPARDVGWRPSIHMPRWASRITLEVTGVRVERVGDITEEDARAEGVTSTDDHGHAHIMEFRSLWCRIYGTESWRANPWVWAVSFRRIEPARADVAA